MRLYLKGYNNKYDMGGIVKEPETINCWDDQYLDVTGFIKEKFGKEGPILQRTDGSFCVLREVKRSVAETYASEKQFYHKGKWYKLYRFSAKEAFLRWDLKRSFLEYKQVLPHIRAHKQQLDEEHQRKLEAEAASKRAHAEQVARHKARQKRLEDEAYLRKLSCWILFVIGIAALIATNN